jgi:hypothetical protein
LQVQSPDPNWAGGGSSFIITATPVAGGPQVKDAQCTAFTVTQTGLQAATGTLGTNGCWP